MSSICGHHEAGARSIANRECTAEDGPSAWNGQVVVRRLTSAPWRYALTDLPVDVRRRGPYRHRPTRRDRWRTRLVALIARIIFSGLRLRYRMVISGRFPDVGCVAVSVHDSYLDGVIPAALTGRITPVVSAVCLRSRFRSWLLARYGVIWSGPQAIPHGAQLVRAGGICWLAPHGFAASRHAMSFDKPRLGAARIALLAGAPVVPITMSATGRGPRQRLEIAIATPVWPLAGESPRQYTTRFMTPLTDARN